MEIQINRQLEIKLDNGNITKFVIEPPIELASPFIHIGFDPGTVNLGLAFLFPFERPCGILYQIELERNKNPVSRIATLDNILKYHCETVTALSHAVVEGASYGNAWRQVELAEARTVFIQWCKRRGIKVKVVSPTSIRKGVFGNGKIHADKVWTNIPADVAAALSCAYYSMQLDQNQIL